MVFLDSSITNYRGWTTQLDDALDGFLNNEALSELLQVLPYQESAKQVQWDLEVLSALQRKKLETLIDHAIVHTQYYSRTARENNIREHDIKDIDDLQRFPSLSKSRLMQLPSDFLATKVMNDTGLKARVSRSSGTSGETQALIAHLEDEFVPNGAVQARYFQAWKIEEGEIITWVRRSPKPPFVAYHAGWHLYHSIRFSEVVKNPQILNECPSKVILGDPFELKAVARAAETKGITIPFKTILITYQILDNATRRTLEKVFGDRIFEIHSMTESSCPIAWECPTHAGLHVNSDYIISEVLDLNDDIVLPPGQVGELTITDLHNHLMPLIRYRTGDLATHISGVCRCGRALSLMAPSDGRIADTVETNNSRITPRNLFWETDPLGLGDFEVILSSHDHITIRYSRTISILSPRQERVLRRKLERLFGKTVQVQAVPELNPASSGKCPILIRST